MSTTCACASFHPMLMCQVSLNETSSPLSANHLDVINRDETFSPRPRTAPRLLQLHLLRMHCTEGEARHLRHRAQVPPTEAPADPRNWPACPPKNPPAKCTCRPHQSSLAYTHRYGNDPVFCRESSIHAVVALALALAACTSTLDVAWHGSKYAAADADNHIGASKIGSQTRE
ncbi:uncharacterized protein K489DRAFT_382923 [Dissoconium aciculare CBS 342.82]|uniref:Uncharacterized protein n=1 Tax=Dissoconium aciculare CBS 342.82 TaxID=1314786 RepID=A0A6J3LWN2_9PEZI|nr:uncharacterized protein K489DRAFT_382923 [Dissoconium aciculare CBS 342.82]KAF1820171.1 hypothetical protein K489DRAFT_382923 [Dissoconium aciculare CBS 342.82]